MIDAAMFHVNGVDPAAVVSQAQMVIELPEIFQTREVIDRFAHPVRSVLTEERISS
jgi:2-oxoglutarate dehydrogenase complex dehydrogenase (E1) component-like enzyme